jgi:DNA mismatch repair ATPase MutS
MYNPTQKSKKTAAAAGRKGKNMFKADLLHGDGEHIYKKPKIIEENVFEDLKITKIFDFCAPLNFDHVKKEDVKYTLETLQNPCTLKKDILFRQGIFKVFLASDTLADNLYKALEDIIVLNKIKENYDFDYGSQKDVDYLKAVNHIFFLKSYKLYLDNIHAAINTSGAELAGSGLEDFFAQLELEKEKMDSPEIAEPMEKVLAYFAGKKNISGELRTQNGIFTKFNFDTDVKNIKSTYFQKVPFLDLLLSIENYLDIYRPEYEIKEKGRSSASGGSENEIYLPDKYTNFEKHFILQLIYDEETENGADFSPLIQKIIEIHDALDVSCFSVVFEQMRFYRTMTKVIKIICEFSENPMCYPEVYEDRPKLEIKAVFDPVIIVQKLADFQEKYNTRNLPEKTISGIVPNEISFAKKNLFVVTGPNNGGKTAFARAVGISLIFFGAGAPVFAAGADFSVGLNIHSHFTASETHLKESGRLQDEINRLNKVMENCDNFSFIVLNETFAGTNSIKALGLFEDFLKSVEKIKFMCVYVTHFHNIAFAAEDKQSEPLYAGCDNLIALMDEASATRTYKILPVRPSDTSYSKDIVIKRNLSWEQLKANLKIGGEA